MIGGSGIPAPNAPNPLDVILGELGAGADHASFCAAAAALAGEAPVNVSADDEIAEILRQIDAVLCEGPEGIGIRLVRTEYEASP